MQAKTLKVHCNPYLHLDHEGRPAGAFPEEFNPRAPGRNYVGAFRRSRETEKAVTMARFTVQPAKHEHWFDFVAEAVVVPNTIYYQRAVKTGELIAADPETCVAVGLHKNHHAPVADVLAQHRAKAAANWKTHYGEEIAIADPFAWQKKEATGSATPASPTPVLVNAEPAKTIVKESSK